MKPRFFAALALVALLFSAAAGAQENESEPDAAATPSPQRLLGLIRAQFRSHRPPPPYVTYTLTRTQKTSIGTPDVVNSYTYHIWCRTLDRAALARRVFRDNYEYPPEFQRPAFNEARDPGPPTADLFEPAPVRSRPISEVPTPEPTNPPGIVIGRIQTFVESDYKVTALERQERSLHLSLEPIRDPDRNRLRELYVDPQTLDLQKLVATDKLFGSDGVKPKIFPVTFTVILKEIAGNLVVTDLQGHVGGGYADDGVDVTFTFRDITFPATLPDWYFNARTYGSHQNDAPR